MPGVIEPAAWCLNKLIYQSPRRHFRRRRVQHGHAHQTTIKPHYQTFRQGTASGTVERGVLRPIQVAVTLVNSDLCDEYNKARTSTKKSKSRNLF